MGLRGSVAESVASWATLQETGMIGLAEQGEPENKRDRTLHSQRDMTAVCPIEKPLTLICTMKLW